MIIDHVRRAGVFGILATLTVSTASAQTNCMAMGSNMVQCYGADGSSTNCMAIGPNMAHCDTIGGQAHPQTQQANASGGGNGENWLDDLMPWREGNFRKKLGKMIAAGDCQGASKLAYEKGRLELGAQIAKTCSPSTGR
jgi:hypothetical protein